MRMGARPNWAHDLVRNAAVAPSKKHQYKKYSRPLHTDPPLSESDDDAPKKIRSYIKPNKNINPYSEGRQKRVFAESMRNHQPPPFKIPKKTSSSSTTPPISRVLPHSELRTHSQPKNKTPTRISHSPSTPSTSNFNHIEKQPIPSSALRKNEENVNKPNCSTSSHHDVRNPVKRHEIPKPPPLPQKRAHIPVPPRNVCPERRETTPQPPPPKKVREEAKASSSTKEYPSKPSKPTNTCAGDDVRNGTSDAVRVETLPWNEHANLAYLYTRKATIFTLDTLPAEEKWYVDEFHGSATDGRNVACGLDNESSPSTSTTSEGDGVELNNSPPRKSCLASSKKRPKRRISFSAEVSTYVYESDVQEEDVMSSTFKEELQSQPMELFQGDLELEPAKTDTCNGVQQNGVRDDVSEQQRRPINLAIVKEEIMEEDDDIQFLFAGNPQYIAELQGNLMRHGS